MDEKELKEIEDAYPHNKHILQLVSEVRRLKEHCKDAQYIMTFHAHACPMNIPKNFSGMSEHLSMYRRVMKDLEPYKGEIDWSRY